MKDNTCGTCGYWELYEDGGFGWCKRHAPKPMVRHEDNYMQYDAAWPKTGINEWCGEYKYKEPV